ncbi:SDR family NAD(P)-dependent oxidoreductase [Komagataeibacter rhaeticus]|nr:SDR family NAD(P)-dependent oxidoreductase [Komagataeibacter rhaeticus]
MGGASGFGRAVASKAAKLGAQVMITSREQDKLTEAQRDFTSAGFHVAGCVVDAADISSITAF